MAAFVGGNFWVCDGGESYIVNPRHRDGSWHSTWAVSTAIEISLFEAAGGNGWGDLENRWALHFEGEAPEDGHLSPVGTEGEYIAKYTRSAAIVPWHGYPAKPSTRHRQDVPPDAVVNRWKASGCITALRRRRLRKGRWQL